MLTAFARLRAPSLLLTIGLLAAPLPLACQGADGPPVSDDAPEQPADRASSDVADADAAARDEVADAGEAADEREAASEREAADESSAEADPFARLHEGPRRADLERFKGRYRAPADHEARPSRVYWVGETCLGSGYLMASAEWGDVAPWIFRTESDLAFVQSNPGPYGGPVRLEFQAPADGQATGLVISGPLEADLERIGDLFENSEREGEDCLIQLM